MKRSAIIESEFSVLVDAIVEYGTVVTFNQLQQFFNKDVEYTRKRISRLVEQGWLTRIKKGLFAISDLSTRGTLSIDQRVVVNFLVQNAYISFESALHYHGVYDQLLSGISAISLKRHKKRTIRGYKYQFIYTQEKYYYGWGIHEIDGRDVKIADTEKALIDMIQFHRTTYTTDIVIEKLVDYQDEIDHEILMQYLLKSNLVTRRIFGFLLDCARVDTQQLLHSVSEGSSVSSISNSENNLYNHKWKLYYDQHFKQYLQH
jgi:predicted transcriptional regulator of viral defense system